jgi:D-sedoheptulose 7-phosphate isomerase
MHLDLASEMTAHNEAVKQILQLEPDLRKTIQVITDAFNNGGRVFTCGNGGSAADAQHFAAELTGRYENDRRGYPAIALTTDTSALTSIGNDYGFEQIFARQLQALANSGDVLIAMSTSGHSSNVIRAVAYARQHQIVTIGLLGRDGGKLANMVDIALTIKTQRTPRIQEAHIFLLHLICEAFEEK